MTKQCLSSYLYLLSDTARLADARDHLKPFSTQQASHSDRQRAVTLGGHVLTRGLADKKLGGDETPIKG